MYTKKTQKQKTEKLKHNKLAPKNGFIKRYDFSQIACIHCIAIIHSEYIQETQSIIILKISYTI